MYTTRCVFGSVLFCSGRCVLAYVYSLRVFVLQVKCFALKCKPSRRGGRGWMRYKEVFDVELSLCTSIADERCPKYAHRGCVREGGRGGGGVRPQRPRAASVVLLPWTLQPVIPSAGSCTLFTIHYMHAARLGIRAHTAVASFPRRFKIYSGQACMVGCLSAVICFSATFVNRAVG